MNEHSILAIDPGVTTGICAAMLDTDSKRLVLAVEQYEFSMNDMYRYLLNSFIKQYDYGQFHVVYEDFQFRNASRSGLNLYPAKLQGVIELVKERRPRIQFYAQQPSVQGDKAYWSNDRLKEYGVYLKGTQHGRSAEKHLLYWLSHREGSQYANIDDLELILA